MPQRRTGNRVRRGLRVGRAESGFEQEGVEEAEGTKGLLRWGVKRCWGEYFRR
jgi:hypothetical protein